MNCCSCAVHQRMSAWWLRCEWKDNERIHAQLADDWKKHCANESENQWRSELVSRAKEPMNEWMVMQWINEWKSQGITGSTIQWGNAIQWINETTNQWMSESINQIINEWVNQGISELKTEWVVESMINNRSLNPWTNEIVSRCCENLSRQIKGSFQLGYLQNLSKTQLPAATTPNNTPNNYHNYHSRNAASIRKAIKLPRTASSSRMSC